MILPNTTGHKRNPQEMPLIPIHQKNRLSQLNELILLFLGTNSHRATINITSISVVTVVNKQAASLRAFTQERPVHSCSTLQARAPNGTI